MEPCHATFSLPFTQPRPLKNCFYHHNVWAFLPGMGNPKAAAGMPTTSWVRLGENGANGGPVPDGRVEHAAGSMGDQVRHSV